jgi:hypothetical protein
MLCEKFEQQLHLRLDQRQRPEEDPELQEHAASCACCREQLAAQKQLFAALQFSYDRLPTPEFADRVVDQALVSKSRDQRYRWMSWGVLAAAAAVLLVALLPGLLNRKGDNEPPAVARTQEKPSPPALPIETDQYGELLNRLVRDWPEESTNRLEPVDQIAGGFRTLASTLHVALDALRSSLPPGEDPEPEEPRPDPIESLKSLQRMLLG